ncbi:MAG: hypothetical protein QOJ76_2044 [Acidobacteriota bacterium]|nr:hypothetical protein [Acidobacteriota bacterium]
MKAEVKTACLYFILPPSYFILSAHPFAFILPHGVL